MIIISFLVAFAFGVGFAAFTWYKSSKVQQERVNKAFYTLNLKYSDVSRGVKRMRFLLVEAEVVYHRGNRSSIVQLAVQY